MRARVPIPLKPLNEEGVPPGAAFGRDRERDPARPEADLDYPQFPGDAQFNSNVTSP